MPYGEILIGTFRQMWRHKKLWGFGLIGLAIGAIGSGIYEVFVLRWQSSWYDMMGQVMRDPTRVDRILSQMLSTLPWVWGSLALLLIAGLLGYLLNLVMRGATMHEAASAWAGASTESGRGLAVGLRRAVYVFAIDLLWALPAVLLGCGVLFGSVLFAATAAGSRADESAAGGVLLAVFGLLGCGLCGGLIVAVLGAVFSPLMYMSGVVGRRGLAAAIGEGWRLARANLGAMIILALLVFALSLAFGLLASLLTLPLSLPIMNTWLRDWVLFIEEVDRGRVMSLPPFRFEGLAAASVLSFLLSWIGSSFLQGYRLTLYAEVYRRLTGIPAAPPLPSPAPGETAVPAALPALTVPDEPFPVVDEEPRPRV